MHFDTFLYVMEVNAWARIKRVKKLVKSDCNCFANDPFNNARPL